jgi:hypothetical protein
MRVFVLALAILLLPLRGWLGDAMALQMVPQHQAPTTTETVHQGHAGHADAEGHEALAAAPPDCQTTCTHCQLCHSVAMTVWPAVPLLGEAPRHAPAFEPVAFASAEPARGFKPPIS